MKMARYTVWPDSESSRQAYKEFTEPEQASEWAGRFVHQFDGENYRVILHVEDNKMEETIDTVENIKWN